LIFFKFVFIKYNLHYLKKAIINGIANIKTNIKIHIIKFFTPNFIAFSDFIWLPTRQIIKLAKMQIVINMTVKKKLSPSYFLTLN